VLHPIFTSLRHSSSLKSKGWWKTIIASPYRALIEQSSTFLHGPPGNGMGSLAEKLLRVYEGAVLIPYAVELDGQVVVLSSYDPAVHQRIGDQNDERDPR